MRYRSIFFTITLATLALAAQGDTAKTTTDIQALHTAWFAAFDTGDGAAMDDMEMPNLVLVFPDGSIWNKDEPRAKTMKKRESSATRAMSVVTVRDFGNSAVLTGLMTSKEGTEASNEVATVVFVKNGGKWKIASAQWTTKAPDAK
jgi:ketosteroid isomerase-like protein